MQEDQIQEKITIKPIDPRYCESIINNFMLIHFFQKLYC